jgi:hypothetical protein
MNSVVQFASLVLPNFALAVVHLVAVACHAQSDAQTSAQFGRWGIETLDTIKRDLWIADRGLYAEKGTADGERPTVPAFMWGAGVQLTALAAATQFETNPYAPQLTAYADAIEKHWIVHNGIGGYSVHPTRRGRTVTTTTTSGSFWL